MKKHEDTVIPLLIILGILGLVLFVSQCSENNQKETSLSDFVTEDVLIPL